MSQTTKLSTKGQVVLPKSLRTAHRWKPGTEFIVRERDGGILLVPKSARASRTWTSLIGLCFLLRAARRVIKEMDEGVAAEARRQK